MTRRIFNIFILLALILLGRINDALANSELDCLARVIYFEARGTTVNEQLVPAFVTLNRANDKNKSLCKVIREPGQFTNTARRISEKGAYEQAKALAQKVITGSIRDVTGQATYFHSMRHTPKGWKHLVYLGRVGAFHLFKNRA